MLRTLGFFCPVHLASAWEAEQLKARAVGAAWLSGISKKTPSMEQECVRNAEPLQKEEVSASKFKIMTAGHNANLKCNQKKIMKNKKEDNGLTVSLSYYREDGRCGRGGNNRKKL